MVDRIKMFLCEKADYKGIDPTELKELADYFHEAIVKALGDAYPVVEEAGPDVVRLRIAVTDIIPTKPEASVVTLVVPFLWLGEAGAGVAEGEAAESALDALAGAMIGQTPELQEGVAAFIEKRKPDFGGK